MILFFSLYTILQHYCMLKPRDNRKSEIQEKPYALFCEQTHFPSHRRRADADAVASKQSAFNYKVSRNIYTASKTIFFFIHCHIWGRKIKLMFSLSIGRSTLSSLHIVCAWWIYETKAIQFDDDPVCKSLIKQSELIFFVAVMFWMCRKECFSFLLTMLNCRF